MTKTLAQRIGRVRELKRRANKYVSVDPDSVFYGIAVDTSLEDKKMFSESGPEMAAIIDELVALLREANKHVMDDDLDERITNAIGE